MLSPAVAVPAATPHTAELTKPADPAPAVDHAAKPVPNLAINYKESGSRAAPIVCEIYSDYECPSCAAFYTQVFPQFVEEYVKTGRVRVVHRDFPLPQHPFAKLAARYANAAGEQGQYSAVVRRLFATQSQWASNGDVDAAVAPVLSETTMRKVRELVKSDPALDATVAADLSIVQTDGINQTPTIVFVRNGVRTKVAGSPSLDLLRRYLDDILAQKPLTPPAQRP